MTNVVEQLNDGEHDDLSLIYPLLAKNFLETSGTHVLFSTLKTVGLDQLLALLPESEKAFWKCSACGWFFERYLNTVFFDPTANKFESAYLPEALIDSLEITDAWREYFHALRKLVISSPAGGLFEPAKYIADAKDLRSKKFMKAQNFSAVRATLGRREAGGFNHFHAEYLTQNPTTQLGVHWKQTINSIETLAGGRNLQSIAREARVFGELVETNKDGRYRKMMVALGAMLDTLHTYTVPGYFMHPYMKMLALTATNSVIADGWNLMATFNGSALGTAFQEGLESNDWAKAKDTFELMIDPIKYRVKDQAKVTAKQVEAAKAALEEAGVVPALIRRYATVGDLDGPMSIWKKPDAVEAAASIDPFARSLDRINGEEKRVISSTDISEISWGTFCDTVLAEYQDIEIYIKGAGAYFSFTLPIDPEAKPILLWDKPEARVPWCTVVRQTPTTPQQNGLEDGKWYPLEQVVKSPMGAYHFVLVQSASIVQDRENCSFGSVVVKDLYVHRGAIDHVLATVGLDSVKCPLIGIRQGSQGCRPINVRGVRNGVKKTFVVVNLG